MRIDDRIRDGAARRPDTAAGGLATIDGRSSTDDG
jgi:hypothetical protein